MSEKHQETGTIILIKEMQHISDTFQKREFVIQQETKNPEYPEFISFEFKRAKCDILDNYKEGQEVTVHFNVGGRLWVNPQGERKYFNCLEAWRMEAASLESASAQNPYQAPAPYQQPASPAPPTSLLPGTVEDDPTVPF